MVFVVGIAVIGYALPAVLVEMDFLSVYIVGIVLGNTEIRNKRNLVNFFDGLTGLMQMLIFFLLGLLAFPSRLPQVVIPALLIAVFLTFVARPVAVALVLTPFKGKNFTTASGVVGRFEGCSVHRVCNYGRDGSGNRK